MRHALLTTLLAFCALAGVAQTSFNSHFPARRGFVTLGLDGGWAYQSSDVRANFQGWGAGLTLAKNLAYRPGGALSFDVRGRLLFTRSYGVDSRPSFGIRNNEALNGSYRSSLDYRLDQVGNDSSFVFANHRTGMGELGLEGVITFNRLRERTGVIFSLFGGVGVDVYRVRTDQLGSDGNIYDYLTLDDNSGRRNTLDNLKLLRDGSFESRTDGVTDNSLGLGAGWMPGAGVELGYQLTPKFSFGVGHKITFSRTDVLDGQRWTNDNQLTDRNDWAHYTNLHLRWILGPRQTRHRGPQIEITQPDRDPYLTNSTREDVRARIRNVNSGADVRCTVNGYDQNFQFRNESFLTSAYLRPGRNEVRIVATNPYGRDEKTVTFILEDDRRGPSIPPQGGNGGGVPPSGGQVGAAPEVRITDPGRSPFSTTRNDARILADVRNVDNRRDVRLLVNGAENSNFTFNTSSLESTVRLQPGRNVVRVEVQTTAGRASDEVVINVENTTPPPPPPPPSGGGKRPEVDITQPRNGSATTNERTYDFRASVRNVDSRDEVTLVFNGQVSRDFSFSPSTGELQAKLDLRPNDNTVAVRARNRSGEDEASATIRRNGSINPPPPPPPPTTPRKPTVRISTPANNATVNTQDVDFRAELQNVAARSEVIVVFNGAAYADFDFNGTAQTTGGRLRAREGDNTLTVRVSNAAGSDEATVRFRYQQPAREPSVSISAPANNATVTVADVDLRANFQNVAARSEVTMTLNGASYTGFEFNGSAQTATGKIRAREGDNSLTVRVSNAGGSDEATVRFRYQPPAAPKPPKVSISAPANNATVTVAQVDLRATFQNVAARSEVAMTLNGKPYTGFEFNPGTLVATGKISARDGANTLTVRVSNAGGSDEATVKFTYQPPAAPKPPTVKITAPADKARLSEAAATLVAETQNVFSSNQLRVTFNGKVLTGVTLDRSGKINVPLTLQSGKNTILVEATTPDGKASASVAVVYSPPVAVVAKPTAVFTNPGKIAKPTSTQSFAFKAKVTGVADRSQVKVRLNGKTVESFSLDTRSGEVAFTASLSEGKNTAEVEATNTAGTATARGEVTYRPAAPKPQVSIRSASQPTVSPFDPATARSSVIADLKNVAEKSQITVKVNGKSVANFNYDASTGVLTCTVDLKKGSNTVTVSANTPGGTAEDSTVVKFE